MNQDKAISIFERARKFAACDDVEVILAATRSSLTRFANNYIHQNVAEDGVLISVRTTFDGKTARATTNKTDDDSLKRALRSAEMLTRVQEQDPEMPPMAGFQNAVEADRPSRYFEATARATPEERAETVGKMVEVAKRHGIVAAGIYSTGESFEAILNSRGLSAFHRQTMAEASITMMADKTGSSGWQKLNAPDKSSLDPEVLAETAAQKAVDSADPKELGPGRYTVILEPSAVLDLMGFMFYDFGAQAVLDERSFLNGRTGTRLFGENISIFEDAYHPLQAGTMHDGEGIPRQRVTLVEHGVIRNLVFSRASAAKMKGSPLAAGLSDIQPTGHGFPLPNEIGDAPMNIVFSGPAPGEEKTVEQMIAETERGVLVTRLWYIREVEPFEKILTGMTRDGTFLVENGRIQHGIRNFRFNQSLVETLQKVDSMGEPRRASGEESFDMVVPAMKVRDFNFTEVTRF
ncbi:MAG: TldD/PmbA family protein [Acidobacteriales bacterium]|nr:TldD/PmbA family protein [Terriglobales bacterium]